MRRLVLLALLVPCAALAQQPPAPPAPPPAPPRVCLPQALLDKMVANAARQPWENVATLMDQVRAAAPGFTACGTAPPAPPAPDQ